MTTHTKIEINGAEVLELESGTVSKATSDYNSSSTFKLTFNNYAGKNATTFNAGDEVTVYAEDVFPPTKKILTAILEQVNFDGKKNDERIIIKGRDFTSVLQNTTVPPEVYNDQEVSFIVKDLMAKYAPTIGVVNVQTTTKIIQQISFNHISLFDALKKLAGEAEFFFFVDVDKDLNFLPKDSTASGVILDGTNIVKAKFTDSLSGVKNDIWVYGDKYLVTVPQESFVADGIGSAFSLVHKPHNTKIVSSGITQIGAVDQMTSVPTTGTQYLVNFNNKEIIFVSGTEAGDHIPSSGIIITADYERDKPIIKRAGNDASQALTKGPRSQIINDKSIKDPRMARDIAKTTLLESLPVKTEGTLSMKGIFDLIPGNTVIVDLPNHGVESTTYKILSVDYALDSASLLSDKVVTVRVSERLRDLTDIIKDIVTSIKELQAGDIDTTDGLSRLVIGPGSMGLATSNWQISTRQIGNSFELDAPANGILGLGSGVGATGSDFNTLYDFNTIASGEAGWDFAATGGDGLHPQNNNRKWNWSDTGRTPSLHTGPIDLGDAFVYTETSYPTVNGDEFIMTLKKGIDMEKYNFLSVAFDRNTRTNPEGQLFFEASSGGTWDVVGSWIGNAETLFTPTGPFDLSGYSDADFQVRFRTLASGLPIYNNDMAITNVNIIGSGASSSPLQPVLGSGTAGAYIIQESGGEI